MCLRFSALLLVSATLHPMARCHANAPDALVIEKEEYNYSLYALESNYDVLSRTITSFQVECKQEVRIHTEEGIRLMQDFVLPQPIDPLYHEIAPASHKADFYLDNMRIDAMEISIERQGKRLHVDAHGERINKEVLVGELSRYGTAYEYRYHLPPLQVMDLVSIHYLLTVPYQSNEHELRSFRIFFHGKWPKLKTRYRFSHSEKAPLQISYMNGSEPHSSFKRELVTDRWDFENLPGCLDETNARPYETLPYLEVLCFPWARDRPVFIRNREVFENQFSIQIGSTSRQFRLLKSFVKENASAADTGAYHRLNKIFNRISTDFHYDSDARYFSGEQLFEAKFGDDLLAERIRELNKYETYSAILNTLGQEYLFVFVMDARCGVVSENFVKPKLRGDFLYGPVLQNGDIVLLYPKTMRCGTFVDELPFYFEDTRMEVMHLFPRNLVRYGPYSNTSGRTRVDFITSPASTEKDNRRKTAAKVRCSGSTGECSIEVHLGLSGQFSTLTRCNYLCNERFSHIDSNYHRLFSDGLAPREKVHYSVDSLASGFPYTVWLRASFTATPQVENRGAETVISLEPWLKHIPVETDTFGRTLDYYPDFRYTDQFTYLFEFDTNMLFMGLPEVIYVSNAFGSYRFEVTELRDHKLLITSDAQITARSVPASRIGDVAEFYSAMAQARASEIRIKQR